MKLSTCCAALLLALASPAVLAAPGSCERIQSDISQRIINNGVPHVAGLILGLILILGGEMIGRVLFYGLHMTVGMAIAG